ncbi:MAG: DEAD/DEAH box helicase [Subdoligranulum variabile]|nr:DEAD/DEAH box helicase [Subdoligranulum variabile]
MTGKWIAEDNHITYSESGILRRVNSETIMDCLYGDNPDTLPSLTEAFPEVHFSSLASPIRISLFLNDSGEEIQLKCYVIRRKKEIPVDAINGVLLDQCLTQKEWFRISGNVEILNSIFKELGILECGTITFNQYLLLKRAAEKEELREITDSVDPDLYRKVNAIQHAEIPTGIDAKLYPYQLDGYNWMRFMLSEGCGCILGDEMGLGKTLQAISIINYQIAVGNKNNLVICPVSLLENWKRECGKFAPDIDVYVHHGSKRTGYYKELLEHDLVVISYNTAVSDLGMLKMLLWDTVILDEAQNIKNFSSSRSIAVKKIPKKAGIAITGTPFENHLTDIWSLADFVLPGYMGTIQDFKSCYDDNMEGASLIEPVLSPIMIRRMVKDVGNDLPEKVVIEQPILMPESEASEYERYRDEAVRLSEKEGLSIGVLQKLRMYCTHPSICNSENSLTDVFSSSVKYQRLCEILEEVIDSGEKAIVFTSYKKMFSIFNDDIAERFHIPVMTINGDTPVEERQSIVDDFNIINSAAVLALNPRAAGTGLNITGANHVIHFNPEWNPALEDQSTARAYRRGQEKTVFVYRLFYANTVEEVVNDRISRKRQMADNAIIGNIGDEQSRQDIIIALQKSPMST